MRQSVLKLLVTALFLSFHSAFGLTLILSDFDNSLVETRESKKGTFRTYFKLFRADQRPTTMIDRPDGPAVVYVSPIDYEKLVPYLARGIGEQFVVSRKQTLQDAIDEKGKKVDSIQAGAYYVRIPDSFERFFPGPDESTNYLLSNAKAAFDRGGNWQGIYFPYMQQILSHQDSAASFGVISARGHLTREWEQLFGFWRRKKLIDHLPNFAHFHSVSRPKYDKFSLQWETTEQKLGVMGAYINSLASTNHTDADMRLDAEEGGYSKQHFLIFVDDKQETVDAVRELFRENAMRRLHNIKFGIFNMGNTVELREKQIPQFAIVTPSGTYRTATAHERLGEPAHISAEEAETWLAGGCVSAVGAGA